MKEALKRALEDMEKAAIAKDRIGDPCWVKIITQKFKSQTNSHEGLISWERAYLRQWFFSCETNERFEHAFGLVEYEDGTLGLESIEYISFASQSPNP